MMKYFLLLVCSFNLFASEQEIQSILDKTNNDQFITRLDLFSKSFLGLPYGKGGPLGEGADARYDQDPLYRFDTYDCTTYVETMISLALSRTPIEFLDTMNKIRYEDGEVDYLKRNHFPSLQWIPNNVDNGLLEEINSVVVPENEQLLAKAIINLPGWLKNIKLEEIRAPYATSEERQDLLLELQSMAQYYQPIEARLNYISINKLVSRPALLKKIPNGSIMNIVRPNWDLTSSAGTHMNVSHQGFVFQKNQVTYFRHASTSGAVVEVKLLDYLKNYVNHSTIKGIHLMRVLSSEL